MAQIKIEITYDPSTETLEQAVSSLVPKAAIDPNALGEAVTQEALARLGKATGDTAPTDKSAATDKVEHAGPTPAATGETSASAQTGDKSAKGATSGQPNASPSAPEPKKVSKTVATALSKAGKREELSAIFAEFGGKKLSDIKEEDYPALMERLVAANG